MALDPYDHTRSPAERFVLGRLRRTGLTAIARSVAEGYRSHDLVSNSSVLRILRIM